MYRCAVLSMASMTSSSARAVMTIGSATVFTAWWCELLAKTSSACSILASFVSGSIRFGPPVEALLRSAGVRRRA